mgnify:CR=1 FL=1
MSIKQERFADLKFVPPAKESQYRWVALTSLLLAIGVILHTISPNIGGVTPNWTIAMYTISINLTNPTLPQCLGIGFVAGAVNVPSSKSAFPYGNIASEIVGALTCALMVKLFIQVKLGNSKIKPAVCAFVSTMGSGLTFTFILKMVLGLTMQMYLYMMVPVVVTVAFANTVITQLLYFPAEKLFKVQSGDAEE